MNIHEIVREMSVMTFGKYKGKSYQELIDEDPEYVLWLIEYEILKGVYADLLEYFVKKSYGDLETFRECALESALPKMSIIGDDFAMHIWD